MTQVNGPTSWVVPLPALTPDKLTEKNKEIAREFGPLFIAFALAANRLALARDPLGLHCFSMAAKQLLSDAIAQCAGVMNASEILE